jgi:tRNA (guanine37-N1)-methyltransferase
LIGRIDIITPFPDMVAGVLKTSILGRAATKGLMDFRLHNLYEFADPPHYKIDDAPFGGGAGMIMKPEPVFRAFKQCTADGEALQRRVIFPSPDGRAYEQTDAVDLLKSDQLVFICGHYKGIDQRVRDELVTDEFSAGDFVLTGGELPALMIVDSVVRLIPGVLNTIESAETDSFSNELLDSPHYTRPRDYEDLTVPEVLVSGHHGEIEAWQQAQREAKTRDRRPDIWQEYLAKKRR